MTVVDSALNYGAARKADKYLERGYNEGISSYRGERERLYGDLGGYREAGETGLAGLQRLLSDPSSIFDDPGYQFGKDEGLRGMMSQNTAMGIGQSGGNLKDLMRYGSDYATKYRGDLIDQYQGTANMGLEGILGGGRITADLTKGLANLQVDRGAGKAAGAFSKAKAGGELIGSVSSLFGGGGGSIF